MNIHNTFSKSPARVAILILFILLSACGGGGGGGGSTNVDPEIIYQQVLLQ